MKTTIRLDVPQVQLTWPRHLLSLNRIIKFNGGWVTNGSDDGSSGLNGIVKYKPTAAGRALGTEINCNTLNY